MNQGFIDTDYLIIGSGAVGMAFADVILRETQARILLVDRHHGPGGHWHDAYPFVRLHQPSAFYGVCSRKLGEDAKDITPLNQGMCERASSAEIVSYYERVMQDFLASGRVQYLPMSECLGDSESGYRVRSLLSGKATPIHFSKKIVDTTYLNTAVPSTHPPKYAIAPGVRCIALNELARVKKSPSGYVVVGAGKTGIDACLWLLENQVPPDMISWVMPRDSWFINRAKVQPGVEFFMQSLGSMAMQMQIVAQSHSVAELFAKLEADDQMLRLDSNIAPSMYHAATISHAELQALRQIKHIIRMGRVERIDKTQIILQGGTVEVDSDRLYVDCSASAAERRPIVPIFQGRKIIPQFVRAFQPTFSAALVAHIEATMEDDEIKNKLCKVVPMPDTPTSWLSMQLASMTNMHNWSQVKGLGRWIAECRLDGFSKMAHEVDESDSEKMAVLARFAENALPAATRLKALLAEAGD